MLYFNKAEVMDILGLDKDKAGDWKTYFELYDLASDDIICGKPDYTKEDIGYSGGVYKEKQKKYKRNELPTLLNGYEYLSESMVKLMIMRADTEQARQERLHLVF